MEKMENECSKPKEEEATKLENNEYEALNLSDELDKNCLCCIRLFLKRDFISRVKRENRRRMASFPSKKL